jgi:hypothetical protein
MVKFALVRAPGLQNVEIQENFSRKRREVNSVASIKDKRFVI